jgi:serine/threonine-protein kinase HipA
MRLEVWMEADPEPVGVLERRDDKSLTFTYAAGSPPERRISMSLPVRAEPYGDAACVAFFGNLLFEGRELDRVMAAHALDRDDIGGLLAHLGADCPGAISVTPKGAGPGKRPGIFPDDYLRLDDARLAAIVRSLHFRGSLPEGERDPSPVAGVQPKLALVANEGLFYVPREGSGAPTTHILKVSPSNDRSLTRYETALLALARELGRETAEAKHLEFYDLETQADIGAILSTRFDRVFDGRTITRIHSEDFCQALGLARALKYERDARRADHRFSAAAVGRLADETAAPGLFRLTFLRQTLFNLAVGNTDNHAKNGAILYRGAHGTLAPLYDIVPVTMDDKVTHELAFTLGGARLTEDVTVAALEQAMRDLGFARPRLDPPLMKLLTGIGGKGIPLLEELGDKSLADGVAAQLTALEAALGIDLAVPTRDFFPRKVRDEKVAGATGGWALPS